MDWQWDNRALWQSCSDASQAQAVNWHQQQDMLFGQLAAKAAQQPLVSIAQHTDELQKIENYTRSLLPHCEQLVVIGTGGATLGAQALCALADDPSRVRFLENCDPVTLRAFLKLPRHSTGWLIVSKSGETVETLAATLSLIAHYADDASLMQRVMVITASPRSTLGLLALAQGWSVIDHPHDLGGRFSVFSVVGLLPAAFAGLDIAAIAQAAQAELQRLPQQKDPVLLQHAAWIAATMTEKPMQVLMAYADRLRPATQWFKQLWAESLGKDGRGQTPLTAIGAIDQHSQLQLYLDGPRDKLVTLWLPQTQGEGITLAQVALPGVAYLAGHTIGDVMHATAEATATTLAAANVPLRVARGKLTPVSLAQWFARQMLETLLVSILIDVDPYSQPAVESGKKLTRDALARRTA